MDLLMLAEGHSERLSTTGSGIPNSIVRHLRAQDHRVSTGDVDLRGLDKLFGAAISYSRSRQRWVVKYHLGAVPFALRSREAVKCIKSRRDRLDAVIQDRSARPRPDRALVQLPGVVGFGHGFWH